jgi:hypothetical protein
MEKCKLRMTKLGWRNMRTYVGGMSSNGLGFASVETRREKYEYEVGY